MSLKNLGFSTAAVLVAMVMSLGLMAQPAKAAAVPTVTGSTFALLITNNGTNGTGTTTAAAGNVTITSAGIGDLAAGTVVLNAPWATQAARSRYLRDKYGLGDDAFVLIYVGLITHERGYEILLRAMAREIGRAHV